MTEMISPVKFGLGASVRRIEDSRFITGAGRYLDDITPAGALHAIVLRSSAAHARVALSGVDAARAADGVHLVLTGNDVAGYGDLPCRGLVKQVDGTNPTPPPYPLLARDTVRHVGDGLAFIVADTVAAARSAAELIGVDYEPLPVVVDAVAALEPGAPLVWPERGSNLAFTYHLGDEAPTTEAFRRAARVVRLDLVNNRLVSNYLEPRGAIGEHDPASGRFTLTLGSQGVHSVRDIVAEILGVGPDRLRVLTPDVGGGFGTKIFVYREYPLVCIAAERLGRPVKWMADRSDHFLGDAQGRDNITTAELALDAEHRIVGLRVELVANIGAYFNQYAPFIPWVGATMSTGLYDIPAAFVRVRGAFTHTVPVDAYRGAGRPEAAYTIERLIEHAARDIGIDRAELRRRNFIRTLPYKTAMGRTYDTGDFAGHLDKALAEADIAGFAAREAESRARGRIRGLGFSSYVEACAWPGAEEATLRLEEDGHVTLFIGTQSNGQGHATAYAQVAAAHLGLDPTRIRLVQGDTDQVASGGGTGGSRSIPLGAASVELAAQRLVEKIKAIASRELEVGGADLELADGAVRVVGTDRSVSLAEVAARAPSEEDRRASDAFQQQAPTFPNGTHVVEVEIDPDTGSTEILRHTIVDDFGVTLNPLLLAGQVHGGAAQGIGQALLENTVYDASGQLVTASFMDYAMPRAEDMPSFSFQTRNVPSTANMLGLKGAGEAGTIGATPAVMNAVVDALARNYGVKTLDMPATPARIWAAIAAAGQS